MAFALFLLFRAYCASHHGGDVGRQLEVRLVVSGLKFWLVGAGSTLGARSNIVKVSFVSIHTVFESCEPKGPPALARSLGEACRIRFWELLAAFGCS